MPGGRPKKDVPFAWPVVAGRERAQASEEWLQVIDPPDAVRAFLFDLLDHVRGLDERTSDELRKLGDAIEADESIAPATRHYLLMMVNRHDIADAAERRQVYTLLGQALIGKPPVPRPARSSGSKLPDGTTVTRPTRDALSAIDR